MGVLAVLVERLIVVVVGGMFNALLELLDIFFLLLTRCGIDVNELFSLFLKVE